MNLINKPFQLLLAVAFFSSCQHNTKDIKEIYLDLDSDSWPVLEANIEKLIQLELSESSLIGMISDFDHFQGRIYILDKVITKSLLLFDINGDYIGKTKVGIGPGELIHPFSFTINREKEQILVYDQFFRSITTMDLDLNIISTQKFDSLYIHDLCIIGDDRYLVKHQIEKGYNQGTMDYYYYSIYWNNFEKAKRLEITNKDKEIQGISNPFSIDNEILFIASWDNNIYELVDDNFEIKYILNFGKYAFEKSELVSSSIAQRWEEVNRGTRIGSLSMIQKTQDFLAFSTIMNRESLAFFHSLKTGKNYMLNDCVTDGMLPRSTIWSAIGTNIFMAIVTPKDLLKFLENKVDLFNIKVMEESNPIVMIFSVKER